MQNPEQLTQPCLSVRELKAKCWVNPDEVQNTRKISVCLCPRDECKKPEICSGCCRSVDTYLELKLPLECHAKKTPNFLQSFCAVLLVAILVGVQPACLPADLLVVTSDHFGRDVLEIH